MTVRAYLMVLLAGLMALSAGPAFAAPSREAMVRQAVADMNVSESEMKAMRYSRMTIGKSRANAGIWIPLETCRGSLVIYLDRYNRATGMRTTGDCTMAHLASR